MSQMEKMASNTQRGQMRPNHGSRSPPFVIVGLLVVIAILAFNYWSVSSTNRELNDQLSSLGSKYRQNDAVLKKRETSLSDELRLMAKQKEEVKTKLGNLENVLRGKEEEISSLKSTVGTKESEVDGLKTDLENQKTQCDENMKKLDNCNSSLTNCNQVLDSGRKESTQKGEELQSCQQREQSLQQELNNLKNSPQQNTQSCTNEVNTMRITLLTKLQQIGGNQVIELLSKAGVDTSGVAIIKSGEQNIQTGDQQNSQQQQGNQVINQNQLQGNQNRPVAGGNVGQKSPSEQGGQSPQNQLHTTTTTATTKTTSIGVESQQDLHGQQGSLGIKKSNESNLNQSVMQQAAPVKQNQSDIQPAMQQQPPLLQNNSSGNGQLQQKNASSSVQKKNSFEGHNQPVAQVGPPQIHQAAGEGEGKDKQGEQDDKQDEDMEEDQALKFKGDGAQDIQEEEDYLDKGFN